MSQEIIPATLGWSNPETAGGESKRLYATDVGQGRWAPNGGRTIERALMENESFEGDRFLVIRIGDRFISDGKAQLLKEMIQKNLEDLNDID